MLHVWGVLAREIRTSFRRSIYVSGCCYETHYEILQLPRDCTQKEIKKAFIKLSKQYHPDKNTNVNTHTRFVRLNEAYTVLNRPETRREYDLSLVPITVHTVRRRRFHGDDFATEDPRNVFRDQSFWENRDKSKDSENREKPYYGIKGVKKTSNLWILTFLVVFALFGVGLQVLLIKKSFAFSRKILDEQSSHNADIYREVRARALAGDGDVAFLDRLKHQAVKQETAPATQQQSPQEPQSTEE